MNNTTTNTAAWFKPSGMMPPEHFGHYECSHCGFWAMRDWLKHKMVLTKFCPQCGYSMVNENMSEFYGDKDEDNV